MTVPAARTRGPEAQLRALGYHVFFQVVGQTNTHPGKQGVICRRSNDDREWLGLVSHDLQYSLECFITHYVERAIDDSRA